MTSAPYAVSLVEQLIASQFPKWATDPISAIENQGHDNRTYRLGKDKPMRLPSQACYVDAIKAEQRWLGFLGRHLSIKVPAVLGAGVPSSAFPYPWSVLGWIEGETLEAAQKVDQAKLAQDLAAFLNELWAIPIEDGLAPAPRNFFRGAHVSVYDKDVAALLGQLDGVINTKAATSLS